MLEVVFRIVALHFKSQMQWPDDLIEIFLSPTSDNELRSILDNLVGECFANPGGGANNQDFVVSKGHYGD